MVKSRKNGQENDDNDLKDVMKVSGFLLEFTIRRNFLYIFLLFSATSDKRMWISYNFILSKTGCLLTGEFSPGF